MVPEDHITWEAEYTDGTCDREKDGKQYAGIDRNNLKKFKLMTPQDTVLFETWPQPGMTGHNLVYRRRISMIQSEGDKNMNFIIGWMPSGPAFVIDVAGGSYRELPDGFDPADAEAYPPVPMPGELWFQDNT